MPLSPVLHSPATAATTRKAGTDLVPRCQRTFERLSGTTCPRCLDAETYEAIRDADLLTYSVRAFDETTRFFGKPPDPDRPTAFWLGLRPECVWEASDRRYDVYLQTGSDPYQLRLQIGHEVFHRVCSRRRVFHWTHEMLACLMSVRLLQSFGFEEYAVAVKEQYEAEANFLSAQAMRAVDLWASPDHPRGFYGRAYVTGAALAEGVGWPALRRLARSGEARGDQPDVEGWLSCLPPGESVSAARIFGITKAE